MAILNPMRIGPRPETKSYNFSLVISGCVTTIFVFLISMPPPYLRWKHDNRKRLYCKVNYWLAYRKFPCSAMLQACPYPLPFSDKQGLSRELKNTIFYSKSY